MAQKRANSEGSIYQKKDGRWQVSLTIGFDENGKQIRKSATAHTQKEALIKLDNLRKQYRDGGPLARDYHFHNPLVADFVDSWQDLMRQQLEPLSQLKYTKECNYIKKYLGTIHLKDLSHQHVVKLYADMEQAGCSSDLRRKVGERLRQILKKATSLGLRTTNPANQVPLPKHSPKEIHPLNPEQARALLVAAQGDQFQALYHVALDTGARQAELFALEWTDFDPIRRTLRIVKSLESKRGHLRIKETKTWASRRTVRLGEGAYQALLAHQKQQKAEGLQTTLIFPAEQGGYLRRSNLIYRYFKALLSRAGLPHIRFHDLRHTCATLLLLAGVDIKTIAARLGHSNPVMLLRVYAHVLSEQEDRAASAIDAILRSSTVAANGGSGSVGNAVSSEFDVGFVDGAGI